jgi:site-specific DNA recombinase
MGAKAIAYLRVSTEEQATRGVSLGAQEAKTRAYATLYDLDLVEVVRDAGQSGKSLDRPGLRRALGLLADGTASALVVMKLDRLTRSVRDLGDLLERHFGPKGAALHSVSEQVDTGTAGGRMVLNILTTIGQWEREVICERTTLALGHKRARGERIGGIPYGSAVGADGRTLVPYPEELAMIARARELRATGLSLRAVGAALAGEGMLGRTGLPLAAEQVKRMLAVPE